jgi:hypothetical protein
MNIRLQFLAALILALALVTSFARANDSPPLNWALAFENDLLSGDQRDKDYTYGINLAFTGPDVDRLKLEPSRWQAFIDEQLQSLFSEQMFLKQMLPEHNNLVFSRQTVEYGLYGFTPDDINVSAVQRDDRPYASLIYAQSARETIDVLNNTSWAQSLSVGVLGLNFVGSLQQSFHSLTDSSEAKGWRHQISDGGEPTAKYSIARQKFWSPTNRHWEVKTTAQVSLGYLTEMSYGLSIRAGDIRSAWWGFKPELVSYGERSNINSNNNWVAEHFFWAGISVKARAYNAFLQGQFRHSDHTYNSDDLRHVLVEGWIGYTIGFNNGYRVSYGIRGHSSEIENGKGDRNLVWGGLVLSKSL